MNIQTLSRSVLDSNVKVVGDVEVLPGRMVVARVDPDGTSVGRVVSKVDAEYLIAGSIDNLDLGSTKVIVELLNVR